MATFTWTIITVVSLLSCIDLSNGYKIEDLNSVRLQLGVTLTQYTQEPGYQTFLFGLIANETTTHCTEPKQDCNLRPKYNRKSGTYKRTIGAADYVFTPDLIHELLPAKDGVTTDTTEITIYMTTYTTYDYLKWTEMVRVIYAATSTINSAFSSQYNITTILVAPPTSYIAKVIDENTTIPTVIACALLGAALLMFIILVPLSNTRFCRKMDDPEELEEGKEKEEKDADQVDNF